MSDHTWTQESISAFVAGGLDLAESERLEAHIQDCPTCAADLAAARRLDHGLADLFAVARPAPGLEDRAVRAIRTARARRRMLLTGWRRTVAAGVAASVGLGVVGAGADQLVAEGRVPIPGARGLESASLGSAQVASPLQNPIPPDSRTSADRLNAARGHSLAVTMSGEQRRRQLNEASKDLTNEDVGFDPIARPAHENPIQLTDMTPQGVIGWGVNGSVPANGSPSTSGAGKPNPPIYSYLDGHAGGNVQQPPGVTDGRGENGTPQWSDTAPVVRGTDRYTRGSAPVVGQSDPVALGMSTDWREGDNKRDGEGKTRSKLSLGTDLSFFRPAEAKPSSSSSSQIPVRGEGLITQEGLGENAPKPATGESVKLRQGVRESDTSENLGRGNGYAELPALGVGQPPAVPAPPPADPTAASRRVVIRSGEIEFEVDSFDAAVATVTKLVNGLKGGFVATVNSDKLPNGKMKGAVVVRVPPELLDGLVLDLRKEIAKGGELKGQRIGSQDITKQYTDLESRLKAAHIMEQRLLQIIKEGKGDIKVLLEAEKELGVWRTKIEEMEGELRYYAHQVALSSLTVTLVEKEIKAAAGLTENERVQAGVEVEEVEAAFRQLLAAVAESKGRVTKSDLKQLAAGQFNATLHFETSPDAAGPIRDRLRQLGRIARLEIDRIQQPDAGTVQKDAKVRRGDTKFEVQLYNLANIAPRETAIIQVAVPDVPAAYQALREVVAKATGRVIVAQLNEQDRQNITAQLDFVIRRTEDGSIGAALAAAGEVVARQVNRTPENDNVTDSRVLYRTNFVSASRLKPRETTTLTLEVQDVDAAVAVLGARVAEARGRQVDSSVARERNGQVTAKAVIDVPLVAAAGFVEQLKGAGVVRVQKAMKDPQAPDGRYATARVNVTLSTAEGIVEGDGSLWPPVKRGLSVSASVLLTSLTWVIFGLCVVLPWAVVGYGGYRLLRRLTGTRTAPTPVTSGPA